MKKLSKVLALLLALVFVLSLAACGDKPASTATPTEGGEATSKPDKVYTFKIDYPNAETNPLYPVLVEWARRIGEESNGRLDMQIYSNGALGKLTDCVTNCIGGLTDGFWSGVTIYPGVFSCTEVFGLPALGAKNLMVVTEAMNAMLEETEYLKKEWEPLHVVALHSGTASPILFSAGKDIQSGADMAGLNLRISNAYTTKWFELLGVNGVSVGFNDGYEYIEKGIIDGGLFFYDQLETSALYEIIDRLLITDKSIYPLTMLCLNKDRYNELPDDLKKIIDDSREWFIEQLPDLYAAQIERVHKKCDEYGVVYYNPNEAFDAELVAAAEESWNMWIKTMTGKGFDGQAIFDTARKYIDKYNAELG
ncbi:MAG TPA: TRAP transporter substrate-binding protein DctP [Clostridiales bacterium]|jgi:TRAP-type C4-dicarboxylate transport system substrate-binding protein|nr:TRAP transporter substrate-binding protein DctP [Clostridiales bacterium]